MSSLRSNLSSSLPSFSVALAVALTLFGAACRGSDSSTSGNPNESPAQENLDACSSVCSCAEEQGAPVGMCEPACAQLAIGYSDPSAVCQSELSNAGISGCNSDCDALVDPAPGDQMGNCGGVDAMSIGDSVGCNFGSQVTIDYVAISVGCNDGETGSFALDFDDGTHTEIEGSCGAAIDIDPVHASSVTITMLDGGGSDGVISFTDDGSLGLFVGYR